MTDTIDIDYIETARQTALDFHGKYIFLSRDDQLELFETEAVKDFTSHPITGESLPNEVLEYIKFHVNCYDTTKDMLLSPETLRSFFNWYSESRKAQRSVKDLKTAPETAQAYNIVRFYMTATDFQDHFKSFDPANSDQERYERDLAEKALRERAKIGTWLLRHSSYNRPVDNKVKEILKKTGIRYYALSYIDTDTQIKHRLLAHHVSKGWKYLENWFPNFLECLEFVLEQNKLPYYRRIGTYIEC